MADYINRTEFLKQYRSLYCSDCDGRKNEKGKIVYEIGDAPCRACDTGDMLDAVEDFPTADVRENTIRTQADRIRAMSDIELATLFADASACLYDNTDVCEMWNGACDNCWLDWLHSPAGGKQ